MSTEPTQDAGTLRVEPDLCRRIEAFASAAQLSPSEVVRRAFEQFEATHDRPPSEPPEETAFDLLDRAGLIGCLKADPAGPTDLATNPDHMDGFGRD